MATTILLVGFVGLIQAVTIMSEALDTARKQQVAQQILTTEIEKLRGKDWTTIANLPATGTLNIAVGGVLSGDLTNFAVSGFSVATTDDNTSLATRAPGFTCTFTRTRLRPTAATASSVTFVQVVYTVTWTSNTGRTHRVSQETFLGQNGLHLSYQQS